MWCWVLGITGFPWLGRRVLTILLKRQQRVSYLLTPRVCVSPPTPRAVWLGLLRTKALSVPLLPTQTLCLHFSPRPVPSPDSALSKCSIFLETSSLILIGSAWTHQFCWLLLPPCPYVRATAAALLQANSPQTHLHLNSSATLHTAAFQPELLVSGEGLAPFKPHT